MTRCATAWRTGGVLLLLALVATGCSDAGTTSSSYVFKPDTSAVKVDTPALRADKAAARIADCPKTRPGAGTGSRSLPDITLPCLGGGRAVHLAGLRGRPTVVNFWSQSCGPCRAESPILQRVHEAARGRVRVLGVDWEDSQPSMAIAFAEQLGVTYPQMADPEAATRKPLHIAGLPMSLFVNSSGTIVGASYGAITSADQLAAMIWRYLGVKVHAGGGS
jgi:cytochrome c biogenesis protein CcmG, thiol:disulfide interchange protein DsbE